jgi:hypothetical protein
MKVINLYGGPGSGKSTTAALVFARLKQDGFNVELVREYAKDVVYEQRYNLLKHQLYITAKQYKRLKDIQDYGKVKLVITDSPLLLGEYYGRDLKYVESFVDIVDHLYSEFENYDIIVNRVKPYETSGRMQTLEEAKKIDEFFKDNIMPDFKIDGDNAGAENLYQYCSKLLCEK